MSISQLIAAVLAVLVIALALIAVWSRRKKTMLREFQLVGARGYVETTLRPEGSILVDGELWRARSRSGLLLQQGQSVRVVGTRGTLLEVEAPSIKRVIQNRPTHLFLNEGVDGDRHSKIH